MPSTVIPSMRYKDAPAAIEWLCRALGFEKNAVFANPDGTIAHAQLTLGDGMIMLGSVSDNDYGKLIRQPAQIGGGNTHGVYIVVPDCRATYENAKAAGAEMVMDLETKDYGGAGFTCRDPEGFVWSIGDYNPWHS